MTPATTFNEEQRTRWNGPDGEYWTSNQDRLDRTLAPVTGPLLAFAQPRAGSTVIDVGCGCGATTIELARAVGPSGRVVGIDLSEPMMALATERLRLFANATGLLGDAVPFYALEITVVAQKDASYPLPADEDEDDTPTENEEPERQPGVGSTGTIPDRHIYCLDFRDVNLPKPYIEEVRRIATECKARAGTARTCRTIRS